MNISLSYSLNCFLDKTGTAAKVDAKNEKRAVLPDFGLILLFESDNIVSLLKWTVAPNEQPN